MASSRPRRMGLHLHSSWAGEGWGSELKLWPSLLERFGSCPSRLMIVCTRRPTNMDDHMARQILAGLLACLWLAVGRAAESLAAFPADAAATMRHKMQFRH